MTVGAIDSYDKQVGAMTMRARVSGGDGGGTEATIVKGFFKIGGFLELMWKKDVFVILSYLCKVVCRLGFL